MFTNLVRILFKLYYKIDPGAALREEEFFPPPAGTEDFAKRVIIMNTSERRDKLNYYLDIAEVVATRGTCLRRNFGAIIVKNDQIISTGYVGAPRGRKNCSDLGYCTREKLGVPRGERYELCRSVHAEQNAIIHADRADMLDSTMFLVGREYVGGEYVSGANPCAMCKRMIINAGIKTVIIRDDRENFRVTDVSETYILGDESLDVSSGY